MTPGEVEDVLEDEEFDVSSLKSREDDSEVADREYGFSPEKFLAEAREKGQEIRYSCFEGPFDTVHYLDTCDSKGSKTILKLRKFCI